jgi:hypothetical protein
MKNKINIILVIAVVVLLGLLFLFAQNSCSASKDLRSIKSTLDADLKGIKQDIATSKTVEDALLKGQGELHLALYGDDKNKGIMTKLDGVLGNVSDLQKKFDERPGPVNPDNFKTLPDCQDGYRELKESYVLCIKLNDEKDQALKLFGSVKDNLVKQVSLISGAVDELQGQVQGWSKIEEKLTKGIEDLDRVYRVNRFWKNVKNVGIGSIAGALAVVILKAVLR